MRASVLHAAGVVELEDRTDPAPGPREVLVRVEAVGVCGSDVHYFEHGRIGSYVVDSPLVLGHEAAGVVVAVGGAVTRLVRGQRVSIEPGVPDFTCRQCLAGRYNLCEKMRFFGTPPIDGAFAELVVVHELFAHPVPDALGPDAAALLEPLSVALWACQKGHVTAGSRVLVTGAGPVGLMAVQVAVALGAAAVTVTDINSHRLHLARELGATEAVDVTDGGAPLGDLEVEVLLECSGHADTVAAAIEHVTPAGAVVLVGMGVDQMALPVSRIQERELNVTGTFRYAHTWPTAIALVASHRVATEPLVTGHFSLDQVEQALSIGRRDPTSIKPIVAPTL